MISRKIDESISCVQETFKDCGDVVTRKFPITTARGRTYLFIFYIDMMVDRRLIETQVITKLMLRTFDPAAVLVDVFEALKEGGITTADIKETEDYDEAIAAVLTGDTVIFFDGYQKGIIISTKGWPNRGIPTTDTEVVVKGSKEAFSEVFRFNTALVRRRIRDSKLKVYQTKVGRRSGTDVALMYLEDVVRPEVLKDIKARIGNINIDAVMDVGCVEQLIEDDWLSPFPQCQVTERPDKAAAAILEGRVAVLVDNSPYAMLLPTTFNTFFQSSEDYYERWQIMSLIRIIRYIAGALAIALPGLYIAVAVFHPSMLPMMLVFKMAGARQAVPFPAVVEILIMEAAFELLREAGIRLPGPVGSTMGIVGGIIIGQAAVEAGIVSPIVVIIVALTGICGFAIPSVALVSGFRLMKYVIIFASAFMGLFGFWVAALLIIVHLASLKSFGIPYLFPFVSGDINGYTDYKDSFLRVPGFKMKKRPIFANPNQQTRMEPPDTGNIRKME